MPAVFFFGKSASVGIWGAICGPGSSATGLRSDCGVLVQLMVNSWINGGSGASKTVVSRASASSGSMKMVLVLALAWSRCGECVQASEVAISWRLVPIMARRAAIWAGSAEAMFSSAVSLVQMSVNS